MKQMEVTILGQSYLLGCPEGGELALLEAVGNVDREMSAIRDAGKVKARERIAVLAALNLAYALAGRSAALAPNAPSAISATPLAPSAADDADDAGESDGADLADLDGLIARLDQALGADGRLL